jgi:hypothetical protein
VFPGGTGYSKWRADDGSPQPPRFFDRLVGYDPDSFNPYACNQDEQMGPTLLAKYVAKSKKIPCCPEEPFLQAKGSFYPNNYHTGYWYPMSLVYTPMEIWQGTPNNNPPPPQTPQKLAKVKYPVNKVVIIDRKTYHCRIVVDTDKSPDNHNNTKRDKQLWVVAGFADGHVAYRDVYEMFDSDVNWTGRFDPNRPTTYVKGRAGILWKDFE